MAKPLKSRGRVRVRVGRVRAVYKRTLTLVTERTVRRTHSRTVANALAR